MRMVGMKGSEDVVGGGVLGVLDIMFSTKAEWIFEIFKGWFVRILHQPFEIQYVLAGGANGVARLLPSSALRAAQPDRITLSVKHLESIIQNLSFQNVAHPSIKPSKPPTTKQSLCSFLNLAA
jgi:hypothetical protein